MIAAMHNKSTQALLNIGHAMDHMMLLIFATAVTSIASDFGLARWEDLMPYGVAAFFFFGIGSLPAGRLGDHWGRRPMMLVFFFGMGAASLLVAATNTPMQMALALALLGAFSSIYHPVGIPMLVQGAPRPGWTIGVNGLVGNLGVAFAAVLTGFLVKYTGWRMAFVVPGLICLACGVAFALVGTRETAAPAKKKSSGHPPSGMPLARLFLIMTMAATSGGLLFNLSTNANFELLTDRLREVSQDPARIGTLLALVYTAASVTQLVVGYLIDRHSLKRLYIGVITLQALLLALATTLDGWAFLFIQLLFMSAIFGAIPFTDAMIVRFVDDGMRSRVAGMRLAVSLGASSVAVWAIGPVVKAAGFTALLGVMALTSVVTLLVLTQLPRTPAPAAATA
ncbi:MAG: MFS transporter [Hydrogenophaga sp.]|nr:MFS transporter [Hydrogenophaga sp.]NIN26295.1 MFS transporter [Hydrogenophaga sp.]NIN31160.1 MFS transporter [Hydrogenophaga sp.]NIN55203.1 MFS transporter [Hydrogenophaga sp.]NIO51246.1 MFS transporter [Hydrogenophaga sp.]